jgi:hypothetical protein
MRLQRLDGVFEDFAWLPEAAELGWQSEWAPGIKLVGRARRFADNGSVPQAPADRDSTPPGTPETSTLRADPVATYLVASELSDHLPRYTWGDHARIAVRALSRGYGLGATIHADSLEDVFAQLGSWPVGLAEDELSRLGVVLVLRRAATGARRVVAAHYVRPVVRDAGGHVQRLGPAVLATWDPSADRLDHFWWGILPQLAERTGRHAGDFEDEQVRRAAYLGGLAAAGIAAPEQLEAAIAGYRAGSAEA